MVRFTASHRSSLRASVHLAPAGAEDLGCRALLVTFCADGAFHRSTLNVHRPTSRVFVHASPPVYNLKFTILGYLRGGLCPPALGFMAFWRRKVKEDKFSSSVLGLDKSIEELKEEEKRVEREFGVRFNNAISKTRESINSRLDSVFESRKKIDEAFLEELEEMLISTDIGVSTTFQVIETVRKGVSRDEIKDLDALKAAMKHELLSILESAGKKGVSSETEAPKSVKPYVLMVVGVNGVGKTTTIGKLAQRIKQEQNEVMICAADTFRAAASEQLEIWSQRAGVPIIQQKQGTDPAAVLFDALKSAKAREADVLIVDTAGRLHNKANLMAELEKMRRVAGREVEEAPHETLLVIDAVTGQNGLEQARQFMKVADVTGIVLTKLDGTAKGGIAVAISKELDLPIRYVGIGEKADDLMVFDPEDYVNGLFA